MQTSGQYAPPQARFTAHLPDSGAPLSGPLANQSTRRRERRDHYPTAAPATLGLQAPHASHRSGWAPLPYLGTATATGTSYLYDATAPQDSQPPTFTPAPKHTISHSTHDARGPYPYLPPLSSSHFDPLNDMPNMPNINYGNGTGTGTGNGHAQPIIGSSQYTDMHLDWLSSVAEASHRHYTPTNPTPTILVSPASGPYSTFSSHMDVPNTCVTGPHSDIGPLYVPGPSVSPFNTSTLPGLTASFSATPSTFDFSASPGLTQHSPAVPCAVRSPTEDPEGDHGLNLIALFSRPPSAPYGNLGIGLPRSKETPSAPPGGLLTVPLPPPPSLAAHHGSSASASASASARRVPGAVPPRAPAARAHAPYATGRKEVRFPNQKKVNVVEDMCRRFPEDSDAGKLLKRICAAEWYHRGDLEPIFGSEGSDALVRGLALGFDPGHSVLLGFVGPAGECRYCGHTSPKRDRIIAHMREHLGLRPFVCMDDTCPCSQLEVRPSFSSREALTSHLRNPNRRITCNFCRKSIKSNNFRRHLNARHRDQVQLPEQQIAKRRSKSLPA